MRFWYITVLLFAVHIMSAMAADIPGDALKDFGAEVKGLRTKVSLVKAAIAAGQPVEIRFAKRNVSKENLVVWHSGFWPNHQIVVKDAQGQNAALTAFGKQTRDAFSPGGGRDKNYSIELKPDTEDASEGSQDLLRCFDLSKLGKYTVELIYEEKQGGWEGRVVSNTASFEIVK